MANCEKRRITRADCAKREDSDKDKSCPSVSFCAGNLAITYDGSCLVAEPRQYQIPDGTYSTVTFKDGCIVGVGNLPVPRYTPNSCCGGVGEGVSLDGENNVISDDPSNLLTMTPAGLAVQPVFRGNGVTVTGSGTPTDPFTISLASSEGSGGASVTTLTPEALEVTQTKAGAAVSMKPIIKSGRYGNLSINDFGQVTDVDTSDTPVVDIQVSSPLKVTNSDGRVTISLDEAKLKELANTSITPGRPVGSFLSADGLRIYVDDNGRIVNLERTTAIIGGEKGGDGEAAGGM